MIDVRDFFAAQVLTGIMQRWREPSFADKDAVVEAYHIADWAMEVRTPKALESAQPAPNNARLVMPPDCERCAVSCAAMGHHGSIECKVALLWWHNSRG